MEGVYDAVGRPGIFRNDRFWLAGDHRVEPELYDKPMVKELMQKSQRARDEFKLVEFQGFNVRVFSLITRYRLLSSVVTVHYLAHRVCQIKGASRAALHRRGQPLVFSRRRVLPLDWHGWSRRLHTSHHGPELVHRSGDRAVPACGQAAERRRRQRYDSLHFRQV